MMWSWIKNQHTQWHFIFILVLSTHWAFIHINLAQKTKAMDSPRVYKINLSQFISKPVLQAKPVIKNPQLVKKPEVIKKQVLKKKVEKLIKKTIKKPDTVAPLKSVNKPKPLQQTPKKSTISHATIKQQYLSYVRLRINTSVVYPSIAKRIGLESPVTVTFLLSKSGQVSRLIVMDNPPKILSKAVLNTINSLSFKPIPNALNQDVLNIKITIDFTLD